MEEVSQLHEWFKNNQRDFPWRINKNPYRVLVSEIMLQQTRAHVVIPYFEKWMVLFPTVNALAEASLDQVIKAWEGLGYYSRARRLHAAALYIVQECGGSLPETKEELAKIPGLGPYTVGAVLSFAFQKRAAAVDGNVARVLARFFLIEESVQKASVKKKLENLAENFLDEHEPWVTAEALIELGASICSRKPKCEICPLQTRCLAHQTGKAEYLPLQPPLSSVTALFRSVFVIQAEGAVLVKKETAGRLMADLYEFPYVEKGREPELLRPFLPLVKHAFTRYIAHLSPYSFSFARQSEGISFLRQCGIVSLKGYVWVELSCLKLLPFSAGHRKILHDWMGA